MSAFTELKPETYYWLGVLFADGNGTQWNRIVLKSKHKAFLEAFGDYVGHPVIEGRGARSTVYRVDFSDKELRKILEDLGWEKTPKTKRYIPDYLFKHPYARDFVRGYFDGDGSIHKDHRKPNGWRLEIATHPTTSRELSKLINQHCPLARIQTYNRNTSERLMIYNYEGVIEVLKWLYKDASICPHPKIEADRVKSLIEGIL